MTQWLQNLVFPAALSLDVCFLRCDTDATEEPELLNLLHYLARHNRHLLIKRMLPLVHIDAITQPNHFTALMIACYYDCQETIELLIHCGANVNRKCQNNNGTALHIACASTNTQIVQALILAGADLNAITSDEGLTPLDVAVAENCEPVVALLLQHGACANTKPTNRIPALLYAIREHATNIVHLLLHHGADPNTSYMDSFQFFAIHSAVQQENMDVLRMLLEKNANADAVTIEGHTALCLAIYTGNEAMARLLIPKSRLFFDPNRFVLNRNLFMFCIDVGMIQSVQVLLDCGIDLGVRHLAPCVALAKKQHVQNLLRATRYYHCHVNIASIVVQQEFHLYVQDAQAIQKCLCLRMQQDPWLQQQVQNSVVHVQTRQKKRYTLQQLMPHSGTVETVWFVPHSMFVIVGQEVQSVHRSGVNISGDVVFIY